METEVFVGCESLMRCMSQFRLAFISKKQLRDEGNFAHKQQLIQDFLKT